MSTSSIGNEDDSVPTDPAEASDSEATRAAASFAESSASEPAPGDSWPEPPPALDPAPGSGKTTLAPEPNDDRLPKGN